MAAVKTPLPPVRHCDLRHPPQFVGCGQSGDMWVWVGVWVGVGMRALFSGSASNCAGCPQ